MNTSESSEPTTRFAWFCLRSQPRREQSAALHVQQRTGVEVFAPRLQVSRRRGALGVSAEALFPGYLFARFEYPRQWRHVVSTQFVTGILRLGGQPPAIADGVIDFLRTHVALANRADPAPVFAPGAWVKIVAGCFRDIDGHVLAFDSKTSRVRLLLNLLGRELQISVPAGQVVPLETRNARYPEALLAAASSGAPFRR